MRSEMLSFAVESMPAAREPGEPRPPADQVYGSGDVKPIGGAPEPQLKPVTPPVPQLAPPLDPELGLSITATNWKAPPKARAEFEKGMEALRNHKPRARRHFESATHIHAAYAAAWSGMGVALEQQKLPVQAENAYERAREADARFPSPYVRLAALYARQFRWLDTLEITNRVLPLKPIAFPGAFSYHALANLALMDLSAAEQSARRTIELDRRQDFPFLCVSASPR